MKKKEDTYEFDNGSDEIRNSVKKRKFLKKDKSKKGEDSVQPENVYQFENEQKHSKKSFLKISIITLIVVAVIIIIARYTTNEDFRTWVNLKFLGKEVTDDTSKVIEINSDENPTIFSYNNYIGILSENTLNIYNSSATSVSELEINISTPIIQTNGNYVAIAEEDGDSFYVLKNAGILWKGSVDGNISKININQNGYVSVIVSNSTYTSIVILFNSEGVELFKTYLPSTYAMCSSVSTDNSYLAIGEIDYSGTVLKSNIRIKNIETTETVYNYSAENGSLITNIEYSNKENAICQFTDSIVSVSLTEETEIYTITDDTCFADIGITGIFTVLEKQSSGLFSYEYNLKMKNLNSNTESLYILSNSLPQQMRVNGKLIALNYGNEVDIVNQNGTLKKNYTSTEQIKDVVVGNNIAGIIYKDKVNVIDV